MTDQQHPITPPPELVAKIRSQALSPSISQQDYEDQLVIAAYRAGADQELEERLTWLRALHLDNLARDLLAARRPKPPSLAEEALMALERIVILLMPVTGRKKIERFDTIRRALKRLKELEGQ